MKAEPRRPGKLVQVADEGARQHVRASNRPDPARRVAAVEHDGARRRFTNEDDPVHHQAASADQENHVSR